MKVTLKKLNESHDALIRLFVRPMDIDAKIKYRASKIVGKIFEEIKSLENQKMDLVKKHDGKPEKGPRGEEILRVPENKMKAYTKELDELMSVEVDIDGQKMPFECVEAVKDMSMLDMHIISDFVEEPKEPETKKKKV